MELFMTGFNGLLLMLFWKFMLRKTLLDFRRDNLFDMRDALRETFLRNGWSLAGPEYRRSRDQINTYLLHMERYVFWEFGVLERRLAATLQAGFPRNTRAITH
jgi:hypothetical protein